MTTLSDTPRFPVPRGDQAAQDRIILNAYRLITSPADAQAAPEPVRRQAWRMLAHRRRQVIASATFAGGAA